MGVYAFAGGKGGVGKTTTAVNVGVALARNGYDVTIVDADIGMTDLQRLLDLDADPGIHGVLAGEAAPMEAVVEGPEDVRVLPGVADLDAVQRADPAKLPAVFDRLDELSEFVLVDTSAGLSHEVLVSLGAVDGIVLLTTAKATALGDTKRTVELADQVDGTVLGTVVTRATHRTDTDAIADHVGSPVVGAIANDREVTDSGIVDPTGDADTAAAGYRHVADLLERVDFAEEPRAAAEQFTDPPLPPEPEPEPDESADPTDDADGDDGGGDGDDDGDGKTGLASAFDPGLLSG